MSSAGSSTAQFSFSIAMTQAPLPWTQLKSTGYLRTKECCQNDTLLMKPVMTAFQSEVGPLNDKTRAFFSKKTPQILRKMTQESHLKDVKKSQASLSAWLKPRLGNKAFHGEPFEKSTHPNLPSVFPESKPHLSCSQTSKRYPSPSTCATTQDVALHQSETDSDCNASKPHYTELKDCRLGPSLRSHHGLKVSSSQYQSQDDVSTKESLSTTDRSDASSNDLTVCADSTATPDDFHIDLEDDGFIITPGKHKIYISSFLMHADFNAQHTLMSTNPGIAAAANYAQDHYVTSKLVEAQLDPRVHQLSFDPGTDLERFRRAAVHFILQQTHDWQLSLSTTYASIFNIHRMLLHYVQPKGVPLTINMFINTVFACLRMAIKHEETPEKTQPVRHISKSMCRLLGVSPSDPNITLSTATTNSAEQECLQVLLDPLIIPNAPDFLERYLRVGNYPASLTKCYEDLASYLLSLSLFSRKDIDHLCGTPPSLLAACALSLAIRVISARKENGYESWPQRLQVYTGYSVSDLRGGVRGLSALLRHKPEGSEVLEKLHPYWASFDWK